MIKGMGGRLSRTRLAWLLVGAAALLYPLTLYLGLASGDRVPDLLQFGWWEALGPLLAIQFGIVGALVLRRHPGHAVGMLAVIGGVCTFTSAFAGAYAAYSVTHGQVLPAAGFAVWLRGWLWYPGLTLLFVLIPALFPDGRLPSSRWKWIVWAVAAGIVIQLAWVSLSQVMFGFPLANGPWPEAGWLFKLLIPVTGVLFLAPMLGAAVALTVRFWRSVGVARQQLKWFLAAVCLQAALWAVSQAVAPLTNLPYYDVFFPLALMAMPLAIGVAILRQRLYDIDIVISRGLVYAGLAAFITIAYLLVVVGIGFVVGTGGRPNLPLSVAAMALVVVLMQPVRVRLQRIANRLVYGVPADPYAALAELSSTAGAGDIDRSLAQIAQAFARGVAGRRARVSLLLPGGLARTATWPSGAAGVFGQTFAINDGTDTIGKIEVEGAGDQVLAQALTGQAGLAMRNLRLSAELAARLTQLEEQAEEVAASRTRLVQVQEAERRRLERDLHDGIQQDLVVLVAKARLARNQLGRDPNLAAETLAELQSSAQHAIADLRALARGIHPAVLSSRGLVDAIESMAARMPIGVRVEVGSADRELRYSPEIEGAAYFVVAEGLANVLKHSGAAQATVAIAASESCLRVTVADDGSGFDLASTRESGLRGLRDRVEALGGRLELDGKGLGTRLAVTLPSAPIENV